MALIDLDADALRAGVAVAGGIAVPAAVAYWFFDDIAGAQALFTVLVLGALVAGSAVAASKQRTGTPLGHGLVVALVVLAVVTAIRILRLAVQGDSSDLGAVLSNLLLTLIAGTVGGLIGGRRAGRRAREAP